MNGIADPRVLWIVSAALGATTIVFTSFALLAVVVWLVALMPLLRRGGLIALSGMLTGFGGLWSFLLWGIDASPYPTDNALGWTAVGIVPLALGLVLLGILVSRARGLRVSRARGLRAGA